MPPMVKLQEKMTDGPEEMFTWPFCSRECMKASWWLGAQVGLGGPECVAHERLRQELLDVWICISLSCISSKVLRQLRCLHTSLPNVR